MASKVQVLSGWQERPRLEVAAQDFDPSVVVLSPANYHRQMKRYRRGGRLADKVASSAHLVKVDGGACGAVFLPGVGHGAAEIRAAPIRYALQPDISACCAHIVRAGDAFLDPENPNLRMPYPDFWIEWSQEYPPKTRMGAHVRCNEAGRAGTIRMWWETIQGIPDLCILDLLFDLDQRGAASDGIRRFSFRNADLPQLDDLLACFVAEIDLDWLNYFRMVTPGQVRSRVAQCLDGAWFVGPLIFAFSSLLQGATPLRKDASDLTIINAARARRGKRPLLDHVHVYLDIDVPSGRPGEPPHRSTLRRSPRLHYVRGHVVRRGGRIFWRAPHMRGDARKLIASKSITVRARK